MQPVYLKVSKPVKKEEGRKAKYTKSADLVKLNMLKENLFSALRTFFPP